MGLFGKRRERTPPEPPPLPPKVSLQNFLLTSGGDYIAKEDFTGNDKETFREMRKVAAEAFRKLGVERDSEQHQYVGEVRRSKIDPSVIWVMVDGVPVDSLLTAAVATFPPEWVGPSPVSVTLARWKSSGLHACEVYPL